MNMQNTVINPAMTSRDGETFDTLLRKWIKSVFGLLGPRCFDRGVLIAEVTGSRKLNKFVEQLVLSSFARPIALTHRAFLDHTQFEHTRLCRRSPGSSC